VTDAKNLPPGAPRILSLGIAPKKDGLQGGGRPTEDDLAELSKALQLLPSVYYGPPPQWRSDGKGWVSMSPPLFEMLRNLVRWNIGQIPWTQARKDWLRAGFVTAEREKGKTLEEAYAAVAEKLAEGEFDGIKYGPSSAAVGEEMIKKSYQRVMRSIRRSLPVEQRPRRTRTRK
jgi:hypothetical protein